MWWSWWAVRQVSSFVLGLALINSGNYLVVPVDLTMEPFPICTFDEGNNNNHITQIVVLGQEATPVPVSPTSPPTTITATPTQKIEEASTPPPTVTKVIATAPPSNPTPVMVRSNLNQAVNDYRTSHGLSKLMIREDICQAARERNRQIATDFSHNGFEVTVSNLNYDAIAENIWQGEPFSMEKVVSGWDESPGHQANMLGNYTFGCGVAENNRAIYLFLR